MVDYSDLIARQDTGASAEADRATAAEPVVSALRDGIPSAWGVDEFLEKTRLKEIKFSEPNPALWRELLDVANPPTLTVCKHLEGEVEDQACRCGYPGSVWADPEHILFTMGDVWGNEPSLQAPRIERSVEIASAQLLTCLYNNAEWLIGLAAQAIEARSDETRSGSAVGESAVRQDAPNPDPLTNQDGGEKLNNPLSIAEKGV